MEKDLKELIMEQAEKLANPEQAEKDRLAEEERLKAEASAGEAAQSELDKAKEAEAEAAKIAAEEEAEKQAQVEAEKKDWKALLDEEKERELSEAKAEEVRKKIEELENDELYKFIDNLRKQGKADKEIRKIIKEVVDFDPKEYTDRDLYEMTIANEVDEDGNPLSQEQKEELYEQFKMMPKTVQERTLSAQRADLDSKYEQVQKMITVNGESKPNYSEAETKAINDLMSLTEEVVGKTIMGVNVTHAMAKELYLTAQKQLVPTRTKSGYDVEEAFKNAWTIKMLPFIVKEEAKSVENATMKRLFKEFKLPSANGKPVETNPNVLASKTEAQINEEKLQAEVLKRSDPFGIKK